MIIHQQQKAVGHFPLSSAPFDRCMNRRKVEADAVPTKDRTVSVPRPTQCGTNAIVHFASTNWAELFNHLRFGVKCNNCVESKFEGGVMEIIHHSCNQVLKFIFRCYR